MCDVYVFAVADVTGFLRKERLVRCGDVIDVIPDSVLSYYIIVLCVGARSGERTFLYKTTMRHSNKRSENCYSSQQDLLGLRNYDCQTLSLNLRETSRGGNVSKYHNTQQMSLYVNKSHYWYGKIRAKNHIP
jgi:hypothetical protein